MGNSTSCDNFLKTDGRFDARLLRSLDATSGLFSQSKSLRANGYVAAVLEGEVDSNGIFTYNFQDSDPSSLERVQKHLYELRSNAAAFRDIPIIIATSSPTHALAYQKSVVGDLVSTVALVSHEPGNYAGLTSALDKYR